MTAEPAKAFVAKHDKNGDGKIQYTELCHVLKRVPKDMAAVVDPNSEVVMEDAEEERRLEVARQMFERERALCAAMEGVVEHPKTFLRDIRCV